MTKKERDQMASIAAQIIIDPAALAPLGSGSSLAVTELLERVAGLLAEVKTRLDGDSRILVDQVEAGRLMGCSPKTLENHGVPCVRVGSRRMYRPAALAAWAAEHERRAES